MRKITKGLEPQELVAWKRKHPNSRYNDLPDNEEGSTVRQAIRRDAYKEQFGLCAYCCKIIDGTSRTTNNEHVVAQALAPNRTLDFSNIVASCTTKGRCNEERKSQPLSLTPLMDGCETELRFKISGKVEGLTPRATDSIKVLGLDTRAIREERKQMVDSLIVPDDLNGLQLIEDELLTDLLNDFQYPVNGQLLPYSPVLINILKQFLAI
ncbi:hypothetical protein BCS42_09315 [Crenothrix sp. D3]|nr:hypothetical protein BCS42_09315 [Crenothrix sp. D3]